MSTVETRYKYQRAQDALTKKDWAGGSAKPEESAEILIGEKPLIQTVSYAPAWYKCVDEAIVNACDHVLRCHHESWLPVHAIKVTVSADLSTISVYNGGQGIPACVHADATRELRLGHDVYVPEFIFGVLFQGSNAEKPVATPDNYLETLIGGTNGIGVKLVNSFSHEFTVCTIDVERKIKYEQRWLDGMSTCERPVLTTANARECKQPYTEVTFKPDYSKFHTRLNAQLRKQLLALIRMRVIAAAMYLQFACRQLSSGLSRRKLRAPVVEFNGEPVAMNTTAQVAAAMFPGAQILTGTIVPGAKRNTELFLAFECSVAIVAGGGVKDLAHTNLTVVNGIITHGGGHIMRARQCIVEAVKSSLNGALNDADMRRVTSRVNDSTFLVICAQIPNPAWGGQRKDVITFGIARFSHYVLDPKFARAIGKALAPLVQEEVMVAAALQQVRADNDADAHAEYAQARNAIDPSIYSPALWAWTKRYRESVLVLGEGNSAVNNFKQGNLSRDKYGTLSLQGVGVNVRQNTDVSGDEEATTQYVKSSKKLDKNKQWNNLLAVTGLKPEIKYDSAPTRGYGLIIIMVDQDHDGKGKILGMILSLFAKLWPRLLDIGYVKWFATPIIRAYPRSGKGVVMSFYSDREYRAWLDVEGAHKPHIVRYYKGIGTHNKNEIISMCKHINEHLIAFVLDPEANSTFDTYYGADPDARKRVLSKPPRAIRDEEQLHIDTYGVVNCSFQLQTHTDWFQRDDLVRKLVHEIDGQIESSRMILNSLMRRIDMRDWVKVAQFAGYVSEHENYHHGEVSLENSICGKGLIIAGMNQLPPVRPSGMFGSRVNGVKDHAQVRYIYMKPNAPLLELLYPPVDYPMLEFQFDGKDRCEPKWFLPILPVAILEHACWPAHGWTIGVWARSVESVAQCVRGMISLDSAAFPVRLEPYTWSNTQCAWRGTVRERNGVEYAYGAYTYDARANVVTITELPLRVWTCDYVKRLRKRIGDGIVADIHDDNTDTNIICIHVYLEPGAYALVQQRYATEYHDGVTEYLSLCQPMYKFINLMNMFGGVTSYRDYGDVMRNWYDRRRRGYVVRADRIEIMHDLRILLYRNIIRYVRGANDNRMAMRTLNAMEQYLRDNDYARIDRSVVTNPGFIANSEIRERALEGTGATYAYLIDLRDRDKTAEALCKYEDKLAKLMREREDVVARLRAGPFRGSRLWLDELDALMKVYREGAATSWTFGDEANYVLD